MSDNIYWLFSTSLQVIATFVGLLAAGFFFIHGKIDDIVKKDETLQEIYVDISRRYYRRFKTLFILTACSIILGLIVIYFNPYSHNWPIRLFEVLVALLNVFTIIWAGNFFIFMIDPDIVTHTAQKLVTENRDLFKTEEAQNISKSKFIEKFTALEKILRALALNAKIGSAGHAYIPLVEVIKELYEKGIITSEQLTELNQLSRARNISAHGSINFIEGELGNFADKLNKELHVINERENSNEAV